MTALRARAVSQILGSGRHRTHALVNVDLTVHDGESVALIGPSGCGKSTLVRILLGLDQPTAGTAEIDGAPVHQYLDEVRRLMQYVPQDPASSLAPRRRIIDQVTAPLRHLKIAGTSADHRRLATAALERVGLDESFLQRRPFEVSGGQAQRVAIARALVTSPRILLADEPTSGLDLPLRRQIHRVLSDLHDEGLGLLLVTHDMAAARALADRVCVMQAGRIVESGPTDTVLSAPQHPLTRRLLDAVCTLPGT